MKDDPQEIYNWRVFVLCASVSPPPPPPLPPPLLTPHPIPGLFRRHALRHGHRNNRRRPKTRPLPQNLQPPLGLRKPRTISQSRSEYCFHAASRLFFGGHWCGVCGGSVGEEMGNDGGGGVGGGGGGDAGCCGGGVWGYVCWEVCGGGW